MSKGATARCGFAACQLVLAFVFLIGCDAGARKPETGTGGATGGPAEGAGGGAPAAGGAGGGAPAAGGAWGGVGTSGALTLLAGGPGPSASVDGFGQNARFGALSAIAFDGVDSLYAADGFAIRRVVLATGRVTTVGQDNVQLLVADGGGTLYYTRRPYSHVVMKLDLASGIATVLAGVGPESCGEYCESSDGVGTQARFNRPAGLALDGGGRMFVAEAGSHIIRVIDLATAAVTTLAGTLGKVGLADGVGTAAQFWQPWQVALDSAGNLYVEDSGNSALRRIVLATGQVTTFTTSGFASSSGGADVVKNFSNDIAIDEAGNLYAAANDMVQKAVPATGQVTTVVGAPGRTGVVLGPLPASLTHPTGIAALPDGRLLIASENMILVATF